MTPRSPCRSCGRVSGILLAWLALALLTSLVGPLLADLDCCCCDGDRCPITERDCPMHSSTSISGGCGCVRSPVAPSEGMVPSGLDLRPGLPESGEIAIGLSGRLDLAQTSTDRPSLTVGPPEPPPPRRDDAR